MKYLKNEDRKHVTCWEDAPRHTRYYSTEWTYISMKMEPNGRIPPRQTMTAGSMNLTHKVQHVNMTLYIDQVPHSKARYMTYCVKKEKGRHRLETEAKSESGLKSHLGFLLAAGHSAWQKVVNVNTLSLSLCCFFITQRVCVDSKAIFYFRPDG